MVISSTSIMNIITTRWNSRNPCLPGLTWSLPVVRLWPGSEYEQLIQKTKVRLDKGISRRHKSNFKILTGLKTQGNSDQRRMIHELCFSSKYFTPLFSLYFCMAILSPSELDPHRTKVFLPTFQFHFQSVLRVSSFQVHDITLFSETCFPLHQMHRLLFKTSSYPFLPNWSHSHLWCVHPISAILLCWRA